jgi:hypothetical protein
MRRLAFALCLFTATTAFAGFSKLQDFRPATAEELELKDVSYAPGAAAAILDWVEVDDDSESFSAEYYRIKILTDDGKKYADVEVPYIASYPMEGRVTDIAARTIQPDGTIVPFNGKVYDKVLYKGNGMRMRAKTFSLPNAQAGSILEFRYQRRWSRAMLLDTSWALQREIPVLHARLSFTPYISAEYRSYYTSFNLPEGKLPERSARDTWDMELTNLPVFQDEEFAPPDESLQARVMFYYMNSRVKPEKFWSNETAEWNRSIENFIGNVDASIVQPLRGKTPIETLQNIYGKVQTFRNLSFEDETKAGEKKNAAKVIAAAEGYRSEINRAFVAMARAAGLDASVVRVAPRDRYFFSQNIAESGQVRGEIAMVKIGEEKHYFDPGTPTAPFGVVSWEKSNVLGVRIGKGTPAEFFVDAEQKPEQAVTRRSADLRLNGDRLEGSITATFTGQEALRRRLRTFGDDEATRTKDLEDEAKGWFPDGATVKLTKVTGATSWAEPLAVTFDVTLSNLVSEAGSRTVLPISVFAANAKNPFASATRTHPIYFPFPHRAIDDVKVTLPESLSLADVPPPAELKGGALQYANAVKRDGNTVTFTRNVSVATMLVDQPYYRALRNFYSAMVSADQKPLVLVAK